MANSEAWVTLATNDSYCLGALVLASSLRRVGTTRDLVILITPGVSLPMRTNLETVFNLVQEVNVLDSGDAANLALLTRPELGITFTKLHCWKLTQYTKCVFLDADTLVIQNCDELFQRDEFSAAPDAGWPDCFNSGVFVYRPSQETFDRLLAFAMEQGSFDGGDQGLLNSFFRDWATTDISRHLPFIYNMVASAVYSYLPAYRVFGQNVKIAHFIGPNKPWLQFLDTATGSVRPSSDQENIRDLLQAWWDIFKAEVHQKLLPEMGEELNATVMEQVQNFSSQFMDPLLASYSSQSHFQPEDPVDLDNLNIAIRRYPPVYNTYTPPPVSYDPPPPLSYDPPKSTHSDPPHVAQIMHNAQSCSQSQDSHEHFYSSHPRHDNRTTTPVHIYPDPSPQTPEIPLNSTKVTYPSPPPKSAPIGQSQTTDSEAVIGRTSPADSSSSIIAEPPTETGTKGLAAVFAQMSLEGSKSTELLEQESTMRKHAWEQGHIDFLGKDSFDNIFKKIQESMAQASSGKSQKEKSPEKVKEPSPPKTVIPAPEVVSRPLDVPVEPTSTVPASEPAAGLETPVGTPAQVPEPKSQVETVVSSDSTPSQTNAAPSVAPPSLSTESPFEVEVRVPVNEPLVTQTHGPELCVCHPHTPSQDIVDAPMSAELSLEELEEQILAVERAALEKKLGEQKRVAEQKLISERAAAEASAKKQEAIEEAAKLVAPPLEPTPVIQQEVKEVKVEESQSVKPPPAKSEEAPVTDAPAQQPDVPAKQPEAPGTQSDTVAKEPEPPVIQAEVPAAASTNEPEAPPKQPEVPVVAAVTQAEAPSASTKEPEAPAKQPEQQVVAQAEAPSAPTKEPEPAAKQAEGPAAAPAKQPEAASAPRPKKAGPGKKEEASTAPPKKPDAPAVKKDEAAGGKPQEPKAPPRKQAGKVWSLSSVSTGIMMVAGISLGTLLLLRR